MPQHDFFRLFVVSVIVMGLAHTLTKERIFEPLRRRLGGRETWLGYLVSCPYCASHWIAFGLVPLTGAYEVEVVPGWGLVGAVLRWFLSSVFVATMAAFLRIFFLLVDESQALVRRRQKEEQLALEAEREEEARASVNVLPTGDGRAAPERRH